MKKTFRNTLFLIIATLITSGICLPVFSQKKNKVKKSRNVMLIYNYPSDKAVKYLRTTKIVQNMEIEEQSMQTNVNSVFGCSIKSLGTQEKNLKLEINVDTLGQTIDSPMGSTGGAINSVKGKTFTMILSPDGKEIDISAAQSITYTVQEGASADLSQAISDFFPDMPEKPVKPGFTWSTTDSTTSKSSTMTVKMKVNSENKFEGFENIDGRDYAKITSALSGTREMKTKSQGMDILMYGPFKGNLIIYFDQKLGYFVKQSLTTTMPGTIEIESPESMTFPLVMDVNQVTEVRK
jgi:hypothetical protein